MYILRTGEKSIRARPLDRNDGAARLAAPEQGLDPKLLNESCRQASPSQVRDAFGPRDGNEHTRRAIASDGVHSAQQYGPAGLVYSFPPTENRLCCKLRVCIRRTIGLRRSLAWGQPVAKKTDVPISDIFEPVFLDRI
jgi:hypothetical protein